MIINFKAMLIIHAGDGDSVVPVLFNPSEYSISSSNNFAKHAVQGLTNKVYQFMGGEEKKLSLDLFFDTYEMGIDVRMFTSLIMRATEIDEHLHAPPLCTFMWGSLRFKGVITSVTQNFTMFLSTGIPVRAKLSLQFETAETIEEQRQKAPFQSADRTKQRVLLDKEQLWAIAAKEYDDPSQWRVIAKANQIENPRLLQTGNEMIIPRLG